jgi:hypothetical protein
MSTRAIRFLFSIIRSFPCFCCIAPRSGSTPPLRVSRVSFPARRLGARITVDCAGSSRRKFVGIPRDMWYVSRGILRAVQSDGSPPLVMLHGGPGGPGGVRFFRRRLPRADEPGSRRGDLRPARGRLSEPQTLSRICQRRYGDADLPTREARDSLWVAGCPRLRRLTQGPGHRSRGLQHHNRRTGPGRASSGVGLMRPGMCTVDPTGPGWRRRSCGATRAGTRCGPGEPGDPGAGYPTTKSRSAYQHAPGADLRRVRQPAGVHDAFPAWKPISTRCMPTCSAPRSWCRVERNDTSENGAAGWGPPDRSTPPAHQPGRAGESPSGCTAAATAIPCGRHG